MPQNLQATCTYQQIWALAISAAGQTQDNVNYKDSVLLQTFFAAELRDIWNKEAWPELCDNLTQVAVANNVFSTNVGQPDEMGDILGLYPVDPRISHCWERFKSTDWWLGDGQVHFRPNLGNVWVDYQLPVVDLLDPSLIGQANEATLMAVTLPQRFRLPLAWRGAGRLLGTEDPALASQLIKFAEIELARQASGVKVPWWRISEAVRE